MSLPDPSQTSTTTDQVQPPVTTDSVQPKPDTPNVDEFKSEITRLIKEKAETEQRFNALKQDREQLKAKTLPDEELEEYRSWKTKKEEQAVQRKKEQGKFDELLEEERNRSKSYIQELQSNTEKLISERDAQVAALNAKLRDRVINTQVRSLIHPMVADDVTDIVAREIVTGDRFYIDLDENDNPVVYDKMTKMAAFGDTGKLTVEKYIQSYLNAHPSFKKASVARGSDDGRVTSTTPVLSPPNSIKGVGPGDQITGVRTGEGSPFSMIQNAVKERAEGKRAGFRQFQ